MAVLTVEISEELLTQLQQTGRPAQEVVVEALENAFENKSLLSAQGLGPIETLSADAEDHSLYNFREADEAEEKIEYFRPKRKRTPKDKDLPREEVVRRLLAAGFVRRPEEYDSFAVQEWLTLSEEERQQHIQEMDKLYFPDSPASTYIIESRR